ETQVTALRTLGLLRDGRYFGVLASAARHTNSVVRQTGLRALADLGDARAEHLLFAATRGEDPVERRLGVGALRRIHARAARPRLQSMLEDAAVEVRRAAVFALRCFDDE